MIINWNNTFLSEQEATIPLLSEAVLFGFGAFETLRANRDGYVIKLDSHIKRLRRSLDAIELQLTVPDDDLKNRVHEVVKKQAGQYQRLRILAVPEGVAVIGFPLEISEDIYDGVKVMSVVQHRAIPSVKSLSYLECLLSYRKATRNGFYEALLVDNAGLVYEGSRSNLFWVENNTVFTPGSGMLMGITRQLVLENVRGKSEYRITDLETLKKADEVFLSGSTVGAVPVTTIDDLQIGNGRPGPMTITVMEALKKYYY